MVIASNAQIDCHHIIGVTTADNHAYIFYDMQGCAKYIYESHNEEMYRTNGGMEFDFCPLCGFNLKPNNE